MCKYCEGDIWDRETLESNNRIEYTVGDKELLIASWTPAFDGYNAECNWESEIPINYCPMCRKEAVMNIDDYKPVNNVIRYTVVFYEEPSKKDTWGSNDVMYEIYYNSKDGIMQVDEIGAFGDSTLVAMYQDRRGRGITLKEMLENIEEISNMTYKEFKEKIGGRRLRE